jgi:hypothetical protein
VSEKSPRIGYLQLLRSWKSEGGPGPSLGWAEWPGMDRMGRMALYFFGRKPRRKPWQT